MTQEEQHSRHGAAVAASFTAEWTPNPDRPPDILLYTNIRFTCQGGAAKVGTESIFFLRYGDFRPGARFRRCGGGEDAL